jgi:mono/diheme cytochrome c family protein
MRTRIAVVLTLAVAVAALAQTAENTVETKEIKKVGAKYTNPASGQEMFEAYCASCHGKDARGNGPAASAMKSSVPDITLLAKNNNGSYPSAKIYEVIRGDSALASHGSKDMPVWGRVFSQLSHSATDMQVQQRLHNLTDYVGKLQQK